MIRVENHPNGPRFWVLGRRIHHFHAGVALIALGVRVVWQDRTDLPGWPQPAAPVRVLPGWDPEIGRTTSHGEW